MAIIDNLFQKLFVVTFDFLIFMMHSLIIFGSGVSSQPVTAVTYGIWLCTDIIYLTIKYPGALKYIEIGEIQDDLLPFRLEYKLTRRWLPRGYLLHLVIFSFIIDVRFIGTVFFLILDRDIRLSLLEFTFGLLISLFGLIVGLITLGIYSMIDQCIKYYKNRRTFSIFRNSDA